MNLALFLIFFPDTKTLPVTFSIVKQLMILGGNKCFTKKIKDIFVGYHRGIHRIYQYNLIKWGIVYKRIHKSIINLANLLSSYFLLTNHQPYT